MFEWIGRFFISSSITFDPPFPRTHIFGLWAVLVVLCVLNYLRQHGNAGRIKRGVLAAFRIAVLTGLTVVLLRPVIAEREPTARTKSPFKVVVDVSRSMETCDVPNASKAEDDSRFKAVIRELRRKDSAFKRAMDPSFNLQFYKFSDDIAWTSFDELIVSKPMGERTNLARALLGASASSQEAPTAGILLISDGRDNHGAEVTGMARTLKMSGIPVWTTTVGTDTEGKDVYVSARLNRSFLFKGQKADLSVNVSQTGYAGWYANVTLFREGQPVGISQQVMLNSSSTRLSFPIEENQKGSFQYTVRVEPLRGESDTGNNERAVFVQVVDEKSQVLFLEAEPYWDSKFLLRSLQADPNIEVTAIFLMNDRKNKLFTITQRASLLANGTHAESTVVRMPETKEELYKYDCVILGKGIDAMLSVEAMRLFKGYLVERGGSLVFARGPATTLRDNALSRLDPIYWDDSSLLGVRLELTPAGQVSPIFDFGEARDAGLIIRELPELISVTRVVGEKSMAIVLARAEDVGSSSEIAAIAYQRYGKGKVLSIGATGLWQWALTPKELAKYDDVYVRFWGQMLRWLIYGSDFLPGQDVSFKTDRLNYDIGEKVPLVVQKQLAEESDFAPQILLSLPDGTVEVLMPQAEEGQAGIFTTAVMPETEGSYQADLYDGTGNMVLASLRFTVYSDAVEKRFVAANPGLMEQIASITGGAVLEREEWVTLPDLVEAYEAARYEEPKAKDAWDRFGIFSWLMALFAVEWFVRRRSGLV